MTARADHGPEGNGDPKAIILRPGNVGSNTAADHIEAARRALPQLPRHLRRRVLVRADSGGGETRVPQLAHRPVAAAALLRRHDDHRGHQGRDLAGSRGRVDDGLRAGPHGVRRSRTSPACWTRAAGSPGCALSSARSARTRARSCGSPTSTATASPASPSTQRKASSPTRNCATGGGRAVRTASATPRTPGCGSVHVHRHQAVPATRRDVPGQRPRPLPAAPPARPGSPSTIAAGPRPAS
jgi:hypothetical protein